MCPAVAVFTRSREKNVAAAGTPTSLILKLVQVSAVVLAILIVAGYTAKV
jgi:hypothetical protein